MKSSSPLSWKTLSCSALLHGAILAAAGLVLVTPPQVGVQESSVTAELQVLDQPSASAEAASAKRESPPPPIPRQEILPESVAEETSPDELSEEPSPLEPLPKIQPVVDPLPASAHPPASAAATNDAVSPSRSMHSTHHAAAVARRGAQNIQPDYLKNPPPNYPESARLAREQGVVSVRVLVDSSGSVSRLWLAGSSGHPSLDRAALEAVSTWKFCPAAAAGIPMESEIVVPVRFELHESSRP